MIVGVFAMSLATVSSANALQFELVTPRLFHRETSKILKLGEILQRRNLITPEQLQAALTLQRCIKNKSKLGEVLVAQNLITQLDLQMALMEQAWREYGFWVID